jgi:hypothetical protein
MSLFLMPSFSASAVATLARSVVYFTLQIPRSVKLMRTITLQPLFRFRLIKKPAHPGDKSPERLASNSPFHFPLRRTSCSPSLASDHARSRLDDGGGLLRADKYHTRKVCQDGIAAHDLSGGEFSSISGLTICSAVASSDRSGSTELGTILKCG